MLNRLALILVAGAFTVVVLAALEPTSAAAAQADASFVGADACKKCHFGQYKTWKAMKHAGAWEALPEQYRDPSQKDEHGRACISCHVTGWGEGARGGFTDLASSEHLTGVGCEACHGPGSLHIEAGQRLMSEKRKEFNPGEDPFIQLKTTNCANCHNPHVSHAEYAEG